MCVIISPSRQQQNTKDLMRTLHQIITDRDDKSAQAEAVQMAYTAGQSQMRGVITERIKQNIASLPDHRFRKFLMDNIEHVLSGACINPNYLNGRGDSGKGEAAEILQFNYSL